MKMNIGIIGVGGVGGYFGGKICRLNSRDDIDVFFVARGRHLDEIRKKGLSVRTAGEGDWKCFPTWATDRIEELPVLDICLLCTKSYDLKNVVSRLREKVTPTTIIVPLLNGVDIYERIREDLTTACVLPACVYVGTHIETYGQVNQNGGACKILLGKDPRHNGLFPDRLFDLFTESRIQYEWFEDVLPEIWGKYIFIAAFGLVTAGFDKTMGQVMESPRLSQLVHSVMEEIVQLAGRIGVVLPDSILEDAYRKGGNFPYETKTSFQRDIASGDKPDERDLFGGTILRLGKRWNIDTPVTKELWTRLQSRKPMPEKTGVTPV